MLKIPIKNNKIFPILSCDCCCEEAKVKKCYIKQCDYQMCKKCIETYQGKLCPKCRNPMIKKSPEKKIYITKTINKCKTVLQCIQKKWLLILIISINSFLGLILGNMVILDISCKFYQQKCKKKIFNHQFLPFGILGFTLFSICMIPILFLLLILLDMFNYCCTFGHSSTYLTYYVCLEIKRIIKRR